MEKDILTKKYRIVNLAKSLLLGLMSFNTFILLINVIFFPQNVDHTLVEVFAALYASIDMAALLYNTKNHPSTNIHHVTVQFFYFYIAYYDFAMINLVRPLQAYTCIVYLPIVNGRLSIRNLGFNYEKEVNDLSLLIYATSF